VRGLPYSKEWARPGATNFVQCLPTLTTTTKENQMASFKDALNIKMEEIKRPPLLPQGHYVAQVTKVPEILQEHDNYDYVDFTIKILQPSDDVDSSELQEFGGLNNVVRRHRFLFDKNDEAAFNRTMYQLKRFLLDHLKVEGSEGSSLNELLNQAVNHQFLVRYGRRTDKMDKEIQYEQIAGTAPV
jgi:hypothetical protein